MLKDTDLRKAIRYGINKDEIIGNIYKGSYFKANFPLNTNSYLVEDKNESYFDLSKMEEYLKNAGWTYRRSGWQKTIDYKTKKLELTMVVRKNSNRAEVADYISQSLSEQGILVNVLKVSDSDYSKYIQSRNYDMILAEMTNPIAPDLTSYFGNGNLANFNNNEAKEILQNIRNMTNEEELKTNFTKLYNIYDSEVPFIGIGRNKIYVITNSYLNGEMASKWYNLYFKFNDWYTN